jgi:hypothetical protein
MEGTVTTATATSVVFTCDIFSGTGTFTSWTISLTGQPGTAGADIDFDFVALFQSNLA